MKAPVGSACLKYSLCGRHQLANGDCHCNFGIIQVDSEAPTNSQATNPLSLGFAPSVIDRTVYPSLFSTATRRKVDADRAPQELNLSVWSRGSRLPTVSIGDQVDQRTVKKVRMGCRYSQVGSEQLTDPT